MIQEKSSNTIVISREHIFYQWYRMVVIQVPIKMFIMAPFVVWWVLWVGDLIMEIDGFWDDFLLCGSILSYAWLSLSACFNWQLALDMWSYFSILWAIPIVVAGVELIMLDAYVYGGAIMFFGFLSLIDGLVSTTFRLPHCQWYTEADLEEKKESEKGVVCRAPETIGIPFMLIPLDGGRSIPLVEFPQMSTPSTSQQAYFEEDGDDVGHELND